MTKYVLHGGERRNQDTDLSDFFRELTSVDKSSLNVLLVYFARPEYMWENLSMADISHFENSANKPVMVKVTTLDTFAEDLNWADIIYLKGGDGPTLTDKLYRFDDLVGKFDGKVVGAISAGVNALSSYYYSRKGDRVLHGLGILNKKVFTHFENDLTEELRELERYNEDLEVLTIPEGEFVVINN